MHLPSLVARPLVALFLLSAGVWAQQPAATMDAETQLLLKYAAFDPRHGLPPVPDVLAARADAGLYVVQAHERPDEAFRQALRTAGAELHGYLPHRAYVVRMDRAAAARVAGLPGTRYVGAYQPAWRLEPALVLALASGARLGAQKYNVVLVDKRTDKPALARDVQALGGEVVDLLEGSLLSVVRLDELQLAKVAQLDTVLWIDRWTAPELDMDNARIQGGANYVEPLGGYNGTGVRGHVYEGVEATHPDFTVPMTNVLSGGAADAHGHSTAGIVFGNGTSNPAGRGMAPNALGFYTNYASAQGSRNSIIGTLVNTHQVMFTTASWGDARVRTYTSVSADADDIIFDHRIPWTQSQSNAGNQDSRPQAWAKNIFSIGGVQHFNNSNPADDSWAAGGGSTGPAADGRIKPDLSAYYDSILCSDLTGAAGYSANNWQTSFGGTSGATPIVAGHNAIAIQMYTDALFGNPLPVPNGTRFQNRPLAQTLKALQIANAQQYAFTSTSTNNRREHVGWGFPSLRNLYDNRGVTYLVPETDVLAQGQGRRHLINVPAGRPELKVCMTFVDPAGNPASALARINDLTLRVTSPSGVVYYGNQGLTAGNYSTAGGTPNTVDTVENVFVQNPAAGTWFVDVVASVVAQDAHVATPAVDATYALCVVGGTGTAGGMLSFATVEAYGAGCGGAVQPIVPGTFYELFTAGVDLANSALRFTPNGAGGWTVAPCANCYDSNVGTNLALGDDQLARNQALGFAFPLPGGGTTTAIDVDSNGWVGLVANAHAASDFTETVGEFLANPARIAVLWDDLNPGAGGTVHFRAAAGVALVSWVAVREFGTTNANTAQLQLFPNGEFVLAYGALALPDCLVGYSAGGGAPSAGPSDISNPGAVVTLALAASGPPVFGTTVQLTTGNYPAGALLGAQALSFVQVLPGIDLSPFGMPNCVRLTGLEATPIVLLNGGQSVYPFGVPNQPGLQGLPIHAQTYAFAPGINAAGVTSSNALRLVVGN